MSCISCLTPKTHLNCDLCDQPVCKSCAQFVTDEDYSFLPVLPKELNTGNYCVYCYDAKIEPSISNYQSVMEKAKDILVYNKNQGKETRYVKRDEDPILIKDCLDREELILRLAFQAALHGFNAIVDVELESKKVRENAYQKLIWSGRAVPTNLNPDRLVKDRSIWDNPN